MSMIRIKNNGRPVFIGGILAKNGEVTTVDSNELSLYVLTKSGKHNAKNIEIISGDANDDAVKKVEQVDVGASDDRAELIAALEKKILESNKRIEELVAENSSLSEILSNEIEDKGSEDVEEGKDLGTTEDGDPPTDAFLFNPEKHHIEHRGGGHWYVMDGEEKVYHIKDDEERKAFEAMAE